MIGPDLTGQQLGQYQLRERIGAGGMGTVYSAYQPSMKRDVAIKVLPPNLALSPEYLDRFNRETEIIARLEHPHIIPVHDFGTDKGYSYVVMRLVTGGSLAERMKRYGIPSLSETRDLYQQLCSALDYAHRQDVIHRDVKPGNVLLDEEGNAYLADFGIAKLIGSTVLTQGTGIGTAAYIAPEVARGDSYDGRVDIYALGVMLFALLTGRPPYQAESKDALVYQHIHEPIPSPLKFNPALPEMMEHVIFRAMAKTPDVRYETCKDLADDLAEAVAAASPEMGASETTGFFTMPLPPSSGYVLRSVTPSPTPAPMVYTPVPAQNRNWMMGLVGVGVLAVLGAVLFLIWQLRPEDNVQGQVHVALTMALLQETQNAVNVTQTALSDPALVTTGTDDIDAPPPLLDGTPATPTPIPAGTENTTWTPVIESFNGLSMVFVPAGCTLKDNASNEDCVDGFWLGQMEITNAQYALCVASDICPPPSDRRYFDDPAFADHPVVYVTWDDAQTYADWVGMQLPTVSQWEYAARGPEGWEYSWGNTSPTCELANIGGCGGGTAAVGSDIRTGGASWVGALDMIGNVREWLTDDDGTQKMVRGGDWATDQIRLVEADSADPVSSEETIGFRIAALTAP